jgi:hypothetical protein
MSEISWIFTAPKQIEQVPVGTYSAKFAGVVEFKLDTGEDKLRWSWKVVGGEHAGKDASALTGRTINERTHAGHLISGLLGRKPAQGEDVKQAIDACKDKCYLIGVLVGPKGGKPAVRMVGPMPSM